MTYTNLYKSPLGNITLASDGKNLIGLWFDGQKYYGDTLKSNTQNKDLPIIKLTKDWLDIYFSGKQPNFTPPVFFNSPPL